jgi:hypothetical protein
MALAKEFLDKAKAFSTPDDARRNRPTARNPGIEF